MTDNENVEHSSFMSDLENGNEGKKKRKSGETHSSKENSYQEKVSSISVKDDENLRAQASC